MDVGCLLVPGFPVAIARRDDHSLRLRPIIIGGSPEEHARVRACSLEALMAGVNPGTTLRKALTLCHDAVFLPYREADITREWAGIEEVLAHYSPAIENIDPGHAHLDLRGMARMKAMDDHAFAADLHAAVVSASRLPARLGVSEGVFAAHAAASLDPDPSIGGVTVVGRGRAARFLSALPVEVLPAPPEMHQRLRLFGLTTLGQVAGLPFSAMQAQFGPDGARAWRLARGHDDSEVIPRREEVRVTEETDLPAPVATLEPLVVGTRALIQKALERPEVRGHSLRRLDWTVTLEDGEAITRRFVFREPTSDPAAMLFAVRSRLERLQLTGPATALSLSLSGLCSEYGHQTVLWRTGPRRQRELLEAIEQLTAREGEPQVYRIVEVQPWSRIPERQQALVAFGP